MKNTVEINKACADLYRMQSDGIDATVKGGLWDAGRIDQADESFLERNFQGTIILDHAGISFKKRSTT